MSHPSTWRVRRLLLRPLTNHHPRMRDSAGDGRTPEYGLVGRRGTQPATPCPSALYLISSVTQRSFSLEKTILLGKRLGIRNTWSDHRSLWCWIHSLAELPTTHPNIRFMTVSLRTC
ncbi:hypothetical protein CSKR_111504 [Clonorchis sinensis]|uniref:Uncharacterized protein n=1 Tax=Clonorchis sinensis TaxID=79923 RepID=A0A419PYU9_CLOSI|nr:hypothetical protein CSKR_111504 [Clonorchis sinensis]